MVEKLTIDFDKDLKISEVKEDVNLMMFNSPNFSTDHMKLANEIFKRLQNVKLEININ